MERAMKTQKHKKDIEKVGSMDGGAKEVKQSPRQRYNIRFVFTGHE